MNIILFYPDELDKPLEVHDPRYIHIRDILKAREGETVRAGIVNESYLELTLDDFGPRELHFSYKELNQKPRPTYPLTMIIGTPRPPTAKRLIKDLTTLGVSQMIFTGTDLNEKSYMSSKLWKKSLYKEALIEGAQQAGTTLLPYIQQCYSLKRSLESLPPDLEGIYLHAQNDVPSLKSYLDNTIPGPRVIALGPERGWTDRELTMLDQWGLKQVQLGERILRTETAAACSASMLIQHLYRY